MPQPCSFTKQLALLHVFYRWSTKQNMYWKKALSGCSYLNILSLHIGFRKLTKLHIQSCTDKVAHDSYAYCNRFIAIWLARILKHLSRRVTCSTIIHKFAVFGVFRTSAGSTCFTSFTLGNMQENPSCCTFLR